MRLGALTDTCTREPRGGSRRNHLTVMRLQPGGKNISVSVRHALGNKIQPHRAFRLDPTLSGTSARFRRVLAKKHSFCAYERDQLSPGVPTAMSARIDSKVTATLADR